MATHTDRIELSPSQGRFELLLHQSDTLYPYWDFDKRECRVAALEARIGTMSHGEKILAQFFMDLWFNDGQKRFDLFEAQCVLDQPSFAIIRLWVNDPFIP